jgi:glycosyltransferase involved in cell wall biosynthesis
LYFRSGDVADLANNLAWALANPDPMAALATAAHQHVKQHFSWEVIAGHYDRLYREVHS